VWEAACDPSKRAPDLESEDEEILSAFASHRAAAYWPIEGYRYRQGDLLGSEMATSAHLTTTVLAAHGHDLKPLVQRYLEQNGRRDFGWRGGQACVSFLDFVTSELGTRIVGLADLIALDQAQLRLLVRLSTLAPGALPRAVRKLSSDARYQRSPAASVVTATHDLSRWIEKPEKAHEVVPAAARQRLLVYLRSTEEAPRIAFLGEDAAILFEALAEPRTRHEATTCLGEGAYAKAREALHALTEIGVVCNAPVPARGT
jgi:hypothetical protein